MNGIPVKFIHFFVNQSNNLTSQYESNDLFKIFLTDSKQELL